MSLKCRFDYQLCGYESVGFQTRIYIKNFVHLGFHFKTTRIKLLVSHVKFESNSVDENLDLKACYLVTQFDIEIPSVVPLTFVSDLLIHTRCQTHQYTQSSERN